MDIEELKIYKISMEIADEIWEVVIKWDYFAKDTVGKQWIRAIDSVAANISEGYGRFSFKENQHFSYYARGSLYESRTWLKKAHSRNLVSEELYQNLVSKLFDLTIKINNYISSIGKANESK